MRIGLFIAVFGYVPGLQTADPDSINLLTSKSAEFYGITALYLRDKKPFMQDLPVLFNMLETGQIKPVITARLPLLEAARANTLLESGQAMGNIVLLSPELLAEPEA